MRFSISITIVLNLLLPTMVSAQNNSVTGNIVEQGANSPLIGVTITLTPETGTKDKKGAVTDMDGNFVIEGVPSGDYVLTATYIGYTDVSKKITVRHTSYNMGTISMSVSKNTLKDVVVKTKQKRVEILGDTSQFNADAYKVNRDANAEGLLSKMPGVTTTGGTLKVNGEEVKEVLVDGKPFFGNDPNAAIKNLPAEVIAKIQVFDKQSDQSQFTGFNDGNSQKAINIITKTGKNNGQFGKVYAGYGTENRYNAGGNINIFNGNQRVSIIGLSNNINQQNFSTEDILGVINTSSEQQRGGGGPSSRSGRGPRRPGSGTDVNDFLVGSQNGVAHTNAIGLNYSDDWGKKIKVSGSYFYNNADNNNITDLNRSYILTDTSLFYDENSTVNNKNQNHRLNMRIEYTMDSQNSFIITPRVSLQNNYTSSILNGYSFYNSDAIDSRTENATTTHSFGYNVSNDILYRHKFNKAGRTLSIMLGTELNNSVVDGNIYSSNQYINDTTLLDQQYNKTSNGYTLSSNIMYTEPLTKSMQLMVTYRPKYTQNDADKETNNINVADAAYNNFDTLLSNKYNSTYTTHEGGLGLRFSKNRKLMGMIGLNAQIASLTGNQQFPTQFAIDKDFNTILPMAFINYRAGTGKNIRLMYRTNTNAPSITQLQNVIDNSNSLLLTMGNPNLKQAVQHRIILRYNSTNTQSASSFFAFAMANYTNEYIGNSTYIPTKDTVFANDIVVNQGSQISMPVNLDGYFNGKIFLTYGLPVGLIKSNINLNAGFTYTKTPALINSQLNLSNNYELTGGIVIGSNISEQVDFTISYTGNYNIAKNSLQSENDYTYYNQLTSLKINWLGFKDRIVVNSDVNHSLYTGLTDGFNQSFFLWNVYIGYKFLKNRSLEAKITVYDILNQNTSVSRTISETYIEDSYNNALNRYAMLTLTYTLRNFKI